VNGQSKKTALVVGLAKSGLAAAEALVDKAVQVIATDLQIGPLMQDKAAKLRSMGVQVVLGEHPLSLLDPGGLHSCEPWRTGYGPHL